MIYEADKGEMFFIFTRRMQYEMRQIGGSYRQCVFNDTYFTISVNSDLDDISSIYELKRELQQLKK